MLLYTRLPKLPSTSFVTAVVQGKMPRVLVNSLLCWSICLFVVKCLCCIIGHSSLVVQVHLYLKKRSTVCKCYPWARVHCRFLLSPCGLDPLEVSGIFWARPATRKTAPEHFVWRLSVSFCVTSGDTFWHGGLSTESTASL